MILSDLDHKDQFINTTGPPSSLYLALEGPEDKKVKNWPSPNPIIVGPINRFK